MLFLLLNKVEEAIWAIKCNTLLYEGIQIKASLLSSFHWNTSKKGCLPPVWIIYSTVQLLFK